eukprot:UN01099
MRGLLPSLETGWADLEKLLILPEQWKIFESSLSRSKKIVLIRSVQFNLIAHSHND